jgi:hypothetical protein
MVHESKKAAARAVGVSPQAIANALKGDTPSIKGFMWHDAEGRTAPVKIAPVRDRLPASRNRVAYYEEGKLVKVFPNSELATRELKITRGFFDTRVNRYIWEGKFCYILEPKEEPKPEIQMEFFWDLEARTRENRRPVICKNAAGEVVEEFASIAEAEQAGYSRGRISNAVNGVRATYRSMTWEYGPRLVESAGW